MCSHTLPILKYSSSLICLCTKHVVSFLFSMVLKDVQLNFISTKRYYIVGYSDACIIV